MRTILTKNNLSIKTDETNFFIVLPNDRPIQMYFKLGKAERRFFEILGDLGKASKLYDIDLISILNK